MKFSNHFLRACCLGLLGAIATAAAATPPGAGTDFNISIQRQPLQDALNAWAQQTGLKVVFGVPAVEKATAAGVEGRYTADAALRKLLENTGLSYEYLDAKTVAIRAAKGANAAGRDPAEQMRVAMLAWEAQSPKAAEPDQESGSQQITVQDRRIRPWADGNADIPRTINDPQPYYIFDAKTIEQSGTANIEDFLKQRLTMNTVAETFSQDALQERRTTTTVDLRGLGADKTLILINGRRAAGVLVSTDDEYQPDLNGIPLTAIDRIEVLPSSASGIYGGSAIGGVVNVILKRDYAGGEMRLNYDNVADGDAPGRRVSASYGLSLEDGRTHLNVNASWADREPLMLRDRVWIYQANIADIRSRSSTAIYTGTSPWLGSVPNIVPRSSSVTTLTLKPEYGGAVLNSRNTHVPAGTAPGISAAELGSLLLANAGQWNMDFPLTSQANTGLLRPLGSTPQNRSLQVGVRRQMLPWLELTADLSWNENLSRSIQNVILREFDVRAASPINPFTTDVKVRVPDPRYSINIARTRSSNATFGALLHLPRGWQGMLDYTWSESRFNSDYNIRNDSAVNADVLRGVLNPFVDTMLYPLGLEGYSSAYASRGANRLHSLALRGSGPVAHLPWGQPTVVFGLERRLARTPARTSRTDYPLAPADNRVAHFYARESLTDSGYLEATVPLVKAGRLPALHSLDLQISGRGERFQVDTGTSYQTLYVNRTPPEIIYGAPNLNGEAPVFSRASYSSNNYTLGLKYQPFPDLTLRASRATAFLPPKPWELIRNPEPDPWPSTVDDPQTGQMDVPVNTLGGGNPDLKPQNSRSLNAGIIWQPSWKPLAGLRLNAEYYRIEQFDAIGGLGAQLIIDQEATFPARVTRDENGRITLVDTSLVNLYHRETEGWDLGLDYAVTTRAGRFSLRVAESIILGLRNQYSQTRPMFDAVNFPSEGGAAKHKGNASLNWESGALMLGWSVQYFGAYRQKGAAGGPSATQRAANDLPPQVDVNVLWQGSETIPSQLYHDLLIAWSFDRLPGVAGEWLNGLSLQLGVRNVFDKRPPLDAVYDRTFYTSPFGDTRLRNYWVNARVQF